MYHVLLTNRYLTTRVIPLIAVAAVALCVALVIIVVSVMTGFLDMVKNSGRTLMGDVVISYSTNGIPYYDRLIERIEGLDEAEAATPVVDGIGLLRMPYPIGEAKHTESVQFWAVEPAGFAAVTGYAGTLYWRVPTEEELAAMGENDFRRRLMDPDYFGEKRLQRVYENGLRLGVTNENGEFVNGTALGMHVSAGNDRQKDGTYTPAMDGYWWMPQFEVVLTTVPVKGGTADLALRAERARLRIVNEFSSGVFLIDDRRIIIPLSVGQRLLRLDEAEIVDDEGETIGVDPPRATMVLVRAVEGVTPEILRQRVAEAYEEFRLETESDPSVSSEIRLPAEGAGLAIQTWLQQQSQFIAPIEKERELMRVLFSIVYLVCAGLVLSIFWAIVYEKTRDIGILRSVGASRFGISLIFLRYGAIIGLAGSIVGLGLAYLIVHNINIIHNAMGETAPTWLWASMFALAAAALFLTLWRTRRGLLLPVVMWLLLTIVFIGLGFLLMFHKGTLIWDPSVYYFSEIPNKMDLITAGTTMIGAIIFSVLGAFFPAARAADTDPVKALRYE